ncbi:MAG: helix-turn-helix transcriptional regulator [Candidatus Woesearchaeota archaeon]
MGQMIDKLRNIFNRRKEEKMSKELTSLKSNVLQSFRHIKKDMDEQKRWIEFLHSNHKELKDGHSVLHDKHNHHQEVHAKDIDNINRWVNHLHEVSKDQEKYMKDLEKSITMAFERYNKYLVDLYRIIAEKTQRIDEGGADHGRPQTRLGAQGGNMEDQNYNKNIIQEKYEKRQERHNEDNDNPKSLSYYSEALTRSEKRVLAELCKTDLKLSYKDLAVTLEVSPNTAKNHMCHIRNKGFPIKEYDDAKGVKRFYVPDNMKKILLSKNV